MVVALLGALFLLGAAFLSSVSFESQAINAVKNQQAKTNVVAALEREIVTQLRVSAVGGDSIPFNSEFTLDLLPAAATDGILDSPSAIGNDVSGEIPGVNPLLASVEPYQPTGSPNWFFRYSTDLELAKADIPVQSAVKDGVGGTVPARNLVYIDIPMVAAPAPAGHPDPTFSTLPNVLDQSGETKEGNTVLDMIFPGGGTVHRRDADGDGVVDSYEYSLPAGRYSDAVRGDLPEQLADPNDPDAQANLDIFYAVRIIPHGSMVNLNHSHDELLKVVIDTAEIAGVQAKLNAGADPPFAPESEESTLRRRYFMPPREIPLSTMQGREGILPGTLYFPFLANGDTTPQFIAGDANPQWWPIDTGDDGADTNGIIDRTGALPKWIDWVAPDGPFNINNPGSINYDFRHIMTTVSYDDNLMRIGRDATGAPPFNNDWVEQMQAAERVAPLVNVFLIDQWPNAADSSDPVNARQKISLPGLDNLYLNPASNGGLGGIDTVGSHPTGLSFIGTLQDAFTMMLWNADLDTNGTAGGLMDVGDLPLRTATAAALTANLIDYADSDDTPTPVPEALYDFNVNPGFPSPVFLYYFGLERQPFITEMYASVDQTAGAGPEPASIYAIELHNPYNVAISLNNYALKDISTVAHAMTPHSLTARLNSGLISTFAPGTSIPAGGFVVFHSAGFNSPGGGSVPIPGNWALDPNSIVQLRQDLPDPTGVLLSIRVAVDQFDVAADTFGAAVNFGADKAADNTTNALSVERDTRNWRFVVPAANPVPAQSLGGANTFASDLILPVHLDFANSGNVRTAFPTTGSLLLLSRFANGYDARNRVSLPPFNVPLRGNAGMAPYSQVDNGRMPIFNQTQWANPTPGPTSLNVPWGQLVFDYFTALPLQHTRTGVTDMTPTIDQNGLRVHGRIDINAAPWWVLQGLPFMPDTSLTGLPGNVATLGSIENKIVKFLGLDGANSGSSKPIGSSLAQSIVAYRESRLISDGVNLTADFRPGAGPRLRPNTGFLTVGELANVRDNPAASVASSNPALYDIDGGNLTDPVPANHDFITAAATLIALGDWVTTRSHVFTIYGTLRGAGTKSAVDKRAVRFQETVDRMPCFFDNKLPQRIGQLVVGDYDNARND